MQFLECRLICRIVDCDFRSNSPFRCSGLTPTLEHKTEFIENMRLFALFSMHTVCDLLAPEFLLLLVYNKKVKRCQQNRLN